MKEKKTKKKKGGKKKQAGWTIPVKVRKNFTRFCKSVKSVAQESCGGAIFIWPHLPAQIREWAILEANGKHPVDNGFWKRMENHLIGAIPILLESAPMPEAKKDVEGA